MAYDPNAVPRTALEGDYTYSDALASPRNSLTRLSNIAGAVVSLALVAGVSVWGYKLIVRDVSGIPVVRALEGEMRVRPDDPGGALAQHQGLAVNEVAADGSAAAPAERLVLAPQPVELTDEDMPMNADAVAIVQQAIADQAVTDVQAPEPVNTADEIAQAAQNGSVEELVAILTDGITPLETLDAPAEPQIVAASVAAVDAALLQAPGIAVSLRPKVRPDLAVARRAATSLPATPAVLEATADPATIDANALPAGTRLVQLGAYDSIEVAQVEWAKFSARFQDLMLNKQQIVQGASSGGRTFYRLRAMGFDDLSDARRFCSALVAEGADCIPVVTR